MTFYSGVGRSVGVVSKPLGRFLNEGNFTNKIIISKLRLLLTSFWTMSVMMEQTPPQSSRSFAVVGLFSINFHTLLWSQNCEPGLNFTDRWIQPHGFWTFSATPALSQTHDKVTACFSHVTSQQCLSSVTYSTFLGSWETCGLARRSIQAVKFRCFYCDCCSAAESEGSDLHVLLYRPFTLTSRPLYLHPSISSVASVSSPLRLSVLFAVLFSVHSLWLHLLNI